MATPKRFYEHLNPDINRNFFDVNPEKPPVWKVYNLYFSILIQKRYTISEEEIKHFGVLTTGNQELDEMEMNNRVKWKQNIYQMAQLIEKGIDFDLHKKDGFILIDLEQSVIVYNLVVDTLNTILEAMKTQVHYSTKDFPIDDIRLLDAFAERVWKYARVYYKTNKDPERIDLSPVYQRQMLQRRILQPRQREIVEVPKIPETHQPIAPLISGKLKLRS